MQNLCDKIKSKLKCLPPKDARLCEKYFEKRDFESILAIAKSDLIMKERDDANTEHKKKWEDIDVVELQELVVCTQDYISYINILDTPDIEDYYD